VKTTSEQPRSAAGISLAMGVVVGLAVVWMLANRSCAPGDVGGVLLPRWALAALVYLAALAVGVIAGSRVDVDRRDASDDERW
jgi:hypothetical protein